jgi:hypothetical protein
MSGLRIHGRRFLHLRIIMEDRQRFDTDSERIWYLNADLDLDPIKVNKLKIVRVGT